MARAGEVAVVEIRTKAGVAHLLLLALFAFAGCTSQAHRHSQPEVPPGRRYESALLHPTSRRNCVVTIVREPGVAGPGLNLYLDGNQIARISAGEALTIYVTPHSHVLSARPLFSPSVARRIDPVKDQPVTVRIIDRNGNYELVIADRAWLARFANSVDAWAKQPFTHSDAEH
jgi:hypothetical protein